MTGKQIMSKIKKLYKELEAVQSECKHVNIKKTHWSNESYHMRKYYTDFKCKDCFHTWTEEGSL